MVIRLAGPADVPAITSIYNEVIATSTAVYSDDPVTVDDRLAWRNALQALGYPVLVADDGGAVVGFASFGEWRTRTGYRHTVEHSVHVAAGHRGAGTGRQLVEALFPYARALGKHVVLGAIDAENVASIRFHERLGFTQAGTFREVGWKFERWLDVVFMQRFVEDAHRQSEGESVK